MPKLTDKIFICLFLFCCCSVVSAQNKKQRFIEQLEISEALYPPEDILSASSLVLFSVSKDVEASEWKNIMLELQSFFSAQGIDAVAYVNASTLYNEPGKSAGVPAKLKPRNIKNLILLNYQGEEKPIFLAMGELSNEKTFWNKGEVFWMRMTSELQPLFDELDTYFKTGERNKTNLLVNDYPEYFKPELTNTRIVLNSAPRFQDDNLIALRNWDYKFYEKLGPHRIMTESLDDPRAYEKKWQNRNALFESLNSDTTNIIGFVEEKATNLQLQRLGYDFELQAVFGTHEQLQGFFKPKQPITQFEGSRVVFYLRSLTSNTIYIPENWRPEADWFTAWKIMDESFKEGLYRQKAN